VELYDAIEKRRTIRRFKAPATKEQLKRIVLSGTKAPSGRNTQPWEFILVEDPALAETIAQIKYDITLKMAPNPESLETFKKNAAIQKDSFKNSSVLAVCHHPMGEAGTWLAVENMSLAAVAEGLGTSIAFYMGGPRAEVVKLLGLPEGYELTCILKIGLPAEEGYDRDQSPYGPRRPEYSWLHKNAYGTPL